MFYGVCNAIKTIYILWMIIISIAHKIWLVKCAYKGEKYIRCADCGVLVRKTANNKKYCNSCIKNNPHYEPQKIKMIKCIDCGCEFEINSKDTKTIRCQICREIYKKNYYRKYRRKQRSR